MDDCARSVYAFEPVLRIFQAMERNIQMNYLFALKEKAPEATPAGRPED